MRILATAGFNDDSGRWIPLYMAELQSGAQMPLANIYAESPNMGSWWDNIKKVFKASLPAIGIAALGGVFGDKLKLTNLIKSKKLDELVKSERWKDLERAVRTSLQSQGVIPTNADIQAGMQAIIDETIYQGQAGAVQGVNWNQYIPLILIIAGAAVLIMVMKK